MTANELNKLLRFANLYTICRKRSVKIYDSCGQVVECIKKSVDDFEVGKVEAFTEWYIADQKKRRKEFRK